MPPSAGCPGPSPPPPLSLSARHWFIFMKSIIVQLLITEFLIIFLFSGRNLQAKWKSIRDRYARTRKECPSGSGKKAKKSYVYEERLSFLSKIYESRATSSSLIQERSEIDPTNEACNIQAYVPKEGNARPKKNKRDLVEDKLISFIDASKNKSSNDFVKFCESLYPNMTDFTEAEIFEVKSDILYSIRKIKERKMRERDIASRQSTASGHITMCASQNLIPCNIVQTTQSQTVQATTHTVAPGPASPVDSFLSESSEFMDVMHYQNL